MYVALTALLYGLLAPVNRSISLVAAFFSLVGCTVQIFAGILQLAPLTMLEPSQLLSGFNLLQLRQAAVLSLGLYAQTFQISFVMFGLFEIVLCTEISPDRACFGLDSTRYSVRRDPRRDLRRRQGTTGT